MKTHTITQGTPEWHAYRAEHFNASDAPAMLGVSSYETRTELLHRLATGIAPEIDAATQRRFDDGHRFEALARPIAESIIGEELYPVVGSEGKLSASFDGLTMDETICFEHKTLNEKLRNIKSSDDLPAQYHAQIEQQLMVSGASKCLFMASKWNGDELVEEVHIWVTHNQDMRNALAQGWTQFIIDLANYVPRVIAEKPKAEIVIELPALFVHAKGEITTHNMKEFGEALKAKLEEVRAIALVTDQDFSNAKAAAKMFRDKAKEIKVSKDSMLSQTVTIGEAACMMDAWSKDLNETALQLEKDVEKEDLAKKRLMVSEAGLAYSAHIEALEAETRPIQLNVQRPDFATAIKGKRNYASMQGAVDDALANGKIAADAAAKDILAKLTWCKETSAGYGFLFNDLAQIISKPMDDFQLVITSRIEKHKADEATRIEAETARIQAEATAKAEREAAAKMAQEEARIRAEEQAKARTEAAVIAKAQAEENALVAKHCGAEVAVYCGKQAPALRDELMPSRNEIIELIASTYDFTFSLAESVLVDTFAEVAA